MLTYCLVSSAASERVQQLLQPGVWCTCDPGVPRVQRLARPILCFILTQLFSIWAHTFASHGVHRWVRFSHCLRSPPLCVFVSNVFTSFFSLSAALIFQRPTQRSLTVASATRCSMQEWVSRLTYHIIAQTHATFFPWCIFAWTTQ